MNPSLGLLNQRKLLKNNGISHGGQIGSHGLWPQTVQATAAIFIVERAG